MFAPGAIGTITVDSQTSSRVAWRKLSCRWRSFATLADSDVHRATRSRGAPAEPNFYLNDLASRPSIRGEISSIVVTWRGRSGPRCASAAA